MLVLAYVSVIISVLNIWAVAGIVAVATRNLHPIKGLLKRGK